MSRLTEYRRPAPRYGLAGIAASPWQARHGWFQTEDGGWRKIWLRPGGRALSARRAVVERKDGWWVWRVELFEMRTRATRRICARGASGYLSAAAAFPFADLAARTAD